MSIRVEDSCDKLTAACNELRAAGFKSQVVFDPVPRAKAPVAYLIVTETQEDLDAALKAMVRSLR